jgi:hypothetical protein
MSQTEMPSSDPRYPIGRFSRPAGLDAEQRQAVIADLAAAPARLRAAVAGLSDEQLDTPYRTGGWTVRQVVHHVPDSHLNAYIRCKHALASDEPTIQPYDEDRWANLSEAKAAPVEVSLALLDALHRRWVLALRGMGPADWGRCLVHPDSGRQTIEQLAALYSWHGRHHVAHITALRQRQGWGGPA